MEDQNNKSCIITGANSGLGYWTALEMAIQGWTVFMLCRSAEKAEIAQKEIIAKTNNTNIYIILAELSSLNSIRKAVDTIKSKTKSINVLINNAALVSSSKSLTESGVELQFAVNHLAPFYLTHLTLELLKISNDARIINISSNNHRKGKIHFDDISLKKNYHILKAYDQSKLANILFTYELDRQLKRHEIDISTYCVDPGHINTEIGLKNTSTLHSLAWWMRSKMGVTPQEGAKCQIYVATSDKIDKQSGKYWKNCTPVRSSKLSYDTKTAENLWSLSMELCGIEDYFMNSN